MRADLRFDILEALRDADRDGLNSRELARRTGRHKATVNRALARMLDADLVKAQTDPFDNRFVLYTLTARGAATP